MALICAKLLAIFLARFIIYYLMSVLNILCGCLLIDYKLSKQFIHYSLFWCKINKFILFFGKNLWKSAFF